MLALVPSAVYVAEPGVAGARLYVSEHIEEISGYPAESWMSSPTLWRDLIHPEDAPGRLADEARWANEIPDGRVCSSEYRLIRPDGSSVWVLDVARLTSLDGSALWVGVVHDVSHLRGVLAAAAAGEAHFRSLAEWSPDALLQVDLDGQIIYASPAARTVFPGRIGFHTGQSLLDLVDPDDRIRTERFIARLTAGEEPSPLRFGAAEGDGAVRQLEATGRLMRSAHGVPTGVALSVRRGPERPS